MARLFANSGSAQVTFERPRLPPAFARLAWSNLAAQCSEQMALAAATIVAVLLFDADGAQTGLLQTAQTLPFLILSLPAGVLADRVSRRGLMVAAEAALRGRSVPDDFDAWFLHPAHGDPRLRAATAQGAAGGRGVSLVRLGRRWTPVSRDGPRRRMEGNSERWGTMLLAASDVVVGRIEDPLH
jgi:hypothetical protein